MSLERIVEEWVIWQRLATTGAFNDAMVNADDGVQEVWHSRSWIPFTDVRKAGATLSGIIEKGDIYIKFEEKEPPVVELKDSKPFIKVKDYLTSKKELTLDADLVVLVTGMVARADSNEISSKLKIPIGSDKFFNEIHPKPKPVETVIKGVYIGGAFVKDQRI